jgi:CBS domain-containing protein
MGQQQRQNQQGPPQQGSWAQSPSAPPTPQQGLGGGPGIQSGSPPGASRLGLEPLASTGIESVARTDVVTAAPDDAIEAVIDDMAEKEVGSVVIVDDERAVGILTDREIALALREMPDVLERSVEEVASDDLTTASMDDDAFEVLDLMSDAGVRRIPIVDDDGELQGIVTLDDVLLFLEDNLHTVAETVRAQFPNL